MKKDRVPSRDCLCRLWSSSCPGLRVTPLTSETSWHESSAGRFVPLQRDEKESEHKLRYSKRAAPADLCFTCKADVCVRERSSQTTRSFRGLLWFMNASNSSNWRVSLDARTSSTLSKKEIISFLLSEAPLAFLLRRAMELSNFSATILKFWLF